MGRVGKSTGKGRTSREALKLAERRLVVFDRWRAGETQKEIAENLGLTRQTVWFDVQLAMDEWRAANRGSINEHFEFELRRLTTYELQFQHQFEETGDGKFLEMAFKCGIERRKLLGADAPSRTEVKNDVTIARTFRSKSEMHAELQRRLEEYRARKNPTPGE